MIAAAVIHHVDALRPVLHAWDRLAVMCGQPYAAPVWMLAWWRFVAPKDSNLAVTVVRDGDELVGLGAWYRYRRPSGLRVARLLGSGHRVEPLSVPGREPEVAEAIADALRSDDEPTGAVLLDHIDINSPWPALLSDTFGNKSRTVRPEQLGAPTLTMAGRTHEEYLAGRSANYRKQRKRTHRKLKERGVRSRLVGPGDDLDSAVGAVMKLHHARWNSLGEASGLPDGTQQMLSESARELVPRGRMRIWLLEADDTPIAAEVQLTAGGQTASWNGGFDPAWSELRPGFAAIELAVEHAFEQGDDRVDFGGGAYDYKARLADANEPMIHATILAGGLGHALRATQLLPDRVSDAARRIAKELPIPIQGGLRAVHKAVSVRARD